MSLKLRKPVLPKRKHPGNRLASAASAGPPVIAVKGFSGSGPFSQLGRGLSSMLEGDLVGQGDRRCGAQVVEWEHRDLLQQEIDLQHSHPGLFDPATVVSQHWLSPTVFVQGNVTTDAHGGMAWDLQLVDAQSGAIMGGDKGSTQQTGDFTASGAIADRLLNQLCPHHYELVLDLLSTASLTSYMATGTITRRSSPTPPQPVPAQRPIGRAQRRWPSPTFSSPPVRLKCRSPIRYHRPGPGTPTSPTPPGAP